MNRWTRHNQLTVHFGVVCWFFLYIIIFLWNWIYGQPALSPRFVGHILYKHIIWYYIWILLDTLSSILVSNFLNGNKKRVEYASTLTQLLCQIYHTSILYIIYLNVPLWFSRPFDHQYLFLYAKLRLIRALHTTTKNANIFKFISENL